jgi:PelA/Pel-15E family pectate lyase
LRSRARAAIPRVVDCMVRTQVVVNGTPTIWGQQHDPLTYAPVSARSYEMASLASRESAGVVRFLMSLRSPDARAVAAVHHAADWFQAHEIFGYTYVPYARHDSAGAGPLWARMSEIGSNRPIFSNREGIRLYDYEQLTDRKQGYAWYSDEPSAALKEYERWSVAHPRVLPDGAHQETGTSR